MGYVSHSQLADRPGALELAQVASEQHGAVVDAELLEATLRGSDRSAWDPADIAAADVALQVIVDAIADADGRINGFLLQAGYPVPLNPVPAIVAGWSRDITRYTLHKDRIGDDRSDPIARAYRDAMRLLELTAQRKFALGIEDPQRNDDGESGMAFDTGSKAFGRDALP